MSIEHALIARAQPYMAAAKARNIIRNEISKGCRPEISPLPVSLEPEFSPIWIAGENPENQHHWVPEQPVARNDWVYLQVWISPEQKLDWNSCDLFVKQLQTMIFRTGFVVSGNQDGIAIGFFCHHIDLPIITAAFEGEYDLCEMSLMDKEVGPDFLRKKPFDIRFRDYYPSPPYSHLLTRPQELQTSPLKSLIIAISSIKDPSIGIYQVLLKPVSPEHNWHRNVQILIDLEYTIKLQDGFHFPQRYAQQSPSGDLRQMAWEVESKAHNDKPLYAVAFRVAVINADDKGDAQLSALSTFASLFQHGGRPLSYLTEKEYAKVLSPEQCWNLFASGITYRPGFIVNSQELVGPVHIPPLRISENRLIPLKGLETLPVRSTALMTGTWIGTCDYAGESQRVCLPDSERGSHTHLIGKTAKGKSTCQENIILSDINQEHGVAVLDPHGDLIERLLRLIPERYVERTIYFNPGDPDWIPIFNPLDPIPGQDPGRTTDDIVQAIQSFVTKTGWGDRLEHLLRNMIYSLMLLRYSTFFDLTVLFRNKSPESKILTREILKVVDNETVKHFWLFDYEKYGKDDFGPPKNKLSKLMLPGSVSLMLSQPESRFNFREIMDDGKILLVDLSGIGAKVRGILGCFILSLLHLSALSRSTIPVDQRKQFHIHCDEAHRFMTDSLEDIIAETRKYKVSLSLAHQYMSQFGQRKTDAFSSVGSTIIFNVDSRDAGYLTKDLQKKVKVEDIVSLENYEAIARIGTEIVRFKTRPPMPVPLNNFRDKIISESRKKYCLSKHEVKKWLKRRGERWHEPYSPLTTAPIKEPGGQVEEFEYDEFH